MKKNRKVEKKSNFEKKRKNRKVSKKKKESTVDYYCNPQCFWVWGNSDSPHTI